MTTDLERAFPLDSDWSAAGVRSNLAGGMIGVFPDPDLSAEDFTIQPFSAIAVYGPEGDLVLYAYDELDTVTPDDGGTTTIVVSGRRYKRTSDVILRDSAISATTSAQPVDPDFGDTYIVPVAPTGEYWAPQAKTVATFSARGWIFRQPFVGMIVYVEDEDGLYHYDSSGNWVAGLPIGAISDRSIPVTKLDDPFAVIKVEGVRNTPLAPAPTYGTSFIIGTAPTGEWAGRINEVARWEGAGWEYIVPTEGDMVYNRSDSALWSYRSGLWSQTTPSPVYEWFSRKEVVDVTWAVGGTDILTFDVSGVPGQLWKITVESARIRAVATSGSSASIALRVYFDDESAHRFSLASAAGTSPSVLSGVASLGIYYIEVLDESVHQIRVVALRPSGSGTSDRTASAAVSVETITPSE